MPAGAGLGGQPPISRNRSAVGLAFGLPLEVGELLRAWQHLAVDVEFTASSHNQVRVLRTCGGGGQHCRSGPLGAPAEGALPSLTKVENQDRVERLDDRVGELGGRRSRVAVHGRGKGGHLEGLRGGEGRLGLA